MVVNYRVSRRADGKRQYVRGQVSITIPEGSKVEEFPILSHDGSVTPYFGIVLDPKLAVAPGAEASVFVDMPVDTGIFLSKGRQYTQIDKVDRHDKRFALYGSASDGMVYRYVKTGYTRSRRNGKDAIPAKIVITNKSKVWKTISRVIFEGSAFDMFRDSKGFIGEKIQMDISKEEVITTKLCNVPSIAGAARIDTSSVLLKIKAMRPDTVEMRYGP